MGKQLREFAISVLAGLLVFGALVLAMNGPAAAMGGGSTPVLMHPSPDPVPPAP